MLAYFPKPYPDELLYSVIARCRVHLGLESPKLLLDLLYGNRHVGAVADLPSHLGCLAKTIGQVWQVEPEFLAYKHTLFPLYAPFMPQKNRQLLLKGMLSDSGVGLHMLSGYSAGRLKAPSCFRYCPQCLKKMRLLHGEYFWPRLCQVLGVDCCHSHFCRLESTDLSFRMIHRHEYVPASPALCKIHLGKPVDNPIAFAINRRIDELLQLVETPNPTYWQWSHFYHQVACEKEAHRGRQHVNIDRLHRLFTGHFRPSWLESLNMLPVSSNDWLTSLFRKHRKTFSYLQHILVWECFRPGQSAEKILDEVSQQPKQRLVYRASKPSKAEPSDLEEKRERWQQLLVRYGQKGVKYIRTHHASALYAWLYRNDHSWLLETNRLWHLQRDNHRKIDWKVRDKLLTRMLFRINDRVSESLDMPRRSQAWFINQLPHRASIEKHLAELPLCQAFLQRYAESVAEYQIRRLSRQLIEDRNNKISRPRWRLMRLCGLDESRLQALTKGFLQRL